MTQLKRTPLFKTYEALGAKTIDFGGWELPVQFSSIKGEHEAVRTRAGLFDVSHMGEILVSGENALPFLQQMMTNDLQSLTIEKARYTAMCNEDGGVIDDLIVYKQKDGEYLLVVNAANIEKDYQWLVQHRMDQVSIENVSDQIAQLAIQGPLAEQIVQSLTEEPIGDIPLFGFKQQVKIANVETLISRTGYTGEDGFELYVAANEAVLLFTALLETGKEDGLLPCGLGARDTLRFEACLPLYGQELSETISPLEAGIGFAIKLQKSPSFIGQEALNKQKEYGVPRKLVGIEMIEKGIPRTGYELFVDGQHIGVVTSGTQSPTLKKNIGLALIKTDFSDIGQEVEVQVRKKRVKALVRTIPFYKRLK